MPRDIGQLRPLRGKLIGEVIDNQDYMTESGFLIVNSLKKKKPKAVLIHSIGREFTDEKGRPQTYRARPGQTAYIKRAEGHSLTIDRKLYLILENSDIVGVED